MSRISTDVVAKTLKSLKIKYVYDREEDMYVAVYKLSDDLKGVLQTITRVNNHLVFTTIYPATIKSRYYASICKELLDLNCRSIMGGFNIDSDDSTVSFRSSISLVGGKRPPKAVIEENHELGLSSIVLFYEKI